MSMFVCFSVFTSYRHGYFWGGGGGGGGGLRNRVVMDVLAIFGVV